MKTTVVPNQEASAVNEGFYEEFLGAKRGTVEFKQRFDYFKKSLDEAAKGPFIPVEEMTVEHIVEWGLEHPEEVEAHRKEMKLYGFA